MKMKYAIALSAAAGLAIGAAAVQTLHAQAKPPGFIVAEIDVSNEEGYNKEFLPLAGKALQAYGVKFLVRGGKPEAIYGAPPSKRVVIGMYESVEKAKGAYTSPEYMKAREIGDKYGKFRVFVAEGVAQ
jgi:uncharacterized protein (DUF1330 family)